MDREKVQGDFDELAHLSGGDSGSDRYDSFLLGLIPADAKNILEVGCGSGRFSELLVMGAPLTDALRSVTAVDLSPEMIARAQERINARLGSSPSVSFVCGDFLDEDLNSQKFAKFDCVISAATLHHMTTDMAVPRMKDLLNTGGTLIIHDLRSDDGAADRARSYTAFAYDSGRRFLRTGRFRQPRAVREFWDRHAAGETYLTAKEARKLADRLLPGARVIDHWLWRYTIIWTKE